MADIKAGYQVTLVSWENDADNYKTIIQTGLSEQEAKFTVELAKLFGRKKPEGATERFGNDYPVREEVISFTKEVYEKYGFTEGVVFDDWNEIFTDEMSEEDRFDIIKDIMTDKFTGYPDEWYDSGFFRIIDSIKVHYFPEGAVDKTSEFV